MSFFLAILCSLVVGTLQVTHHGGPLLLVHVTAHVVILNNQLDDDTILIHTLSYLLQVSGVEPHLQNILHEFQEKVDHVNKVVLGEYFCRYAGKHMFHFPQVEQHSGNLTSVYCISIVSLAEALALIVQGPYHRPHISYICTTAATLLRSTLTSATTASALTSTATAKFSDLPLQEKKLMQDFMSGWSILFWEWEAMTRILWALTSNATLYLNSNYPHYLTQLCRKRWKQYVVTQIHILLRSNIQPRTHLNAPPASNTPPGLNAPPVDTSPLIDVSALSDFHSAVMSQNGSQNEMPIQAADNPHVQS
ncbi:hypothetical protein FPV67DRAFT_1444712 [Lyophyllum atratum]|nr:hypothetical protein FPV67DRAFT_1444712 [Lyophyllum atratum]